MEVGVGIALFSMMITAVTFLGGFLLVVLGRLVRDVSGSVGHLEVIVERHRRGGHMSRSGRVH
ncbi:MAG: hypothetical protein ACE5KV_05690 [Thermoplasmata archaeon]